MTTTPQTPPLSGTTQALRALAQKWREDAEDRKDGGYNEWANARLLSADELTALADQLGPEQAQDEVERLRERLEARIAMALRICSDERAKGFEHVTIASMLACLDRS